MMKIGWNKMNEVIEWETRYFIFEYGSRVLACKVSDINGY